MSLIPDYGPHPFQTSEHALDPYFGWGRTVYSPDRAFRYQTIRALHAQEWDDEDREGTLAVLGLRPDPDSSAEVLDSWARPHAEAAMASGFRQLVVVCLYGTMDGARTLDHGAHGVLNGYFATGQYLADYARTIAVALPDGWRTCQACTDTGIAGSVTELLRLQDDGEDDREIEVVQLAGDWQARDGDPWDAYREAPRPRQGRPVRTGLRRVV